MRKIENEYIVSVSWSMNVSASKIRNQLNQNNFVFSQINYYNYLASHYNVGINRQNNDSVFNQPNNILFMTWNAQTKII